LAIVLSILLNRSDYHKLDSKIDAKIGSGSLTIFAATPPL
jgi:hypothetical protein